MCLYGMLRVDQIPAWPSIDSYFVSGEGELLGDGMEIGHNNSIPYYYYYYYIPYYYIPKDVDCLCICNNNNNTKTIMKCTEFHP